jgi:hypothetical protein
MMERRMEKRLLCADLVRIDWNARTLEGVLEDICPQGASVEVEEPIPPGEVVSIAEPAGQFALFSGQVTHCVREDCGYLLGVRFTGPTVWSRGVFKPQHLTDPDELGE